MTECKVPSQRLWAMQISGSFPFWFNVCPKDMKKQSIYVKAVLKWFVDFRGGTNEGKWSNPISHYQVIYLIQSKKFHINLGLPMNQCKRLMRCKEAIIEMLFLTTNCSWDLILQETFVFSSWVKDLRWCNGHKTNCQEYEWIKIMEETELYTICAAFKLGWLSQ